MPLVLAQNEKNAADVKYADTLGASYEFPTIYKNMVKPGELFVYYRGKRTAGTGIQVPHYFGAGKVGPVSSAANGRLRCLIEDYRAFDKVVPFKLDDRYVEPGANGRPSKLVGGYFQRGVRMINQGTFDEICAIGLYRPVPKKLATSKAGKSGKAGSSRSTTKPATDPDRAIHDLAMALATAEAKKQWPDATLFRAPARQQFSLAIRLPKGKTHHIAVKGTAESKPLVRLTTSEVNFSKTHAATYSMWVFYGIDLERGTAKFLGHDGSITDKDFDLQAAKHGGPLRTNKTGKRLGPILD